MEINKPFFKCIIWLKNENLQKQWGNGGISSKLRNNIINSRIGMIYIHRSQNNLNTTISIWKRKF